LWRIHCGWEERECRSGGGGCYLTWFLSEFQIAFLYSFTSIPYLHELKKNIIKQEIFEKIFKNGIL
jgi:hypothetical protein